MSLEPQVVGRLVAKFGGGLSRSGTFALIALVGCIDSPPVQPDTDHAPPDPTDERPDPDDADTVVAPSSDASLQGLDVGWPLHPPFDPANHFYAVRASDLPETVTVVPRLADPGASWSVMLETVDGVDVADDTTFAALPDHRILVDVTSADGLVTDRYAIALLPDDFPELTVSRPGTPSPGWYLIASFTFSDRPPGTGDYLMALDGHGTPAWWRATSAAAFDLRVGRDGRLTYTGSPSSTSDLSSGVTFDSDYGTTSVTAVDTTPRPVPFVDMDIHEYDRLADGGSLLFYDYIRLEDLTAWGGPSSASVLHSKVQELGPTGEVRFEWNAAPAVDYDDFGPNMRAKMGDGWAPIHLNSMEYDPTDGHLVASLRVSSQVVKVARYDDVIAGRDVAAGHVAWRLGGARSDFTFVDDDRPLGTTAFSYQHSARMTGPDTIAIFDNSLGVEYGDIGPARYVEYQLDTTDWTATKIAEYSQTSGLSSEACGSVQKLADGHVVIGWGAIEAPVPDVTEIDEYGDVQIEITLPGSLWSYRAWKFEGDPLTGIWQVPY